MIPSIQSEFQQRALLEKAEAERIIEESPRMDGVESLRVELGEDHSGDPAMWIHFTLRKDLDVDDRTLREFIRYSRTMTRRILDSGFVRFPYTRLEQAA